jgi:hypothetical protein
MLKHIYMHSCSCMDNGMCTHSLMTLDVSCILSLVHACTIHLLGRLKFPPDNYIVDRLKAIHIGSEVLG